jgi:hypothetical protein
MNLEPAPVEEYVPCPGCDQVMIDPKDVHCYRCRAAQAEWEQCISIGRLRSPINFCDDRLMYNLK